MSAVREPVEFVAVVSGRSLSDQSLPERRGGVLSAPDDLARERDVAWPSLRGLEAKDSYVGRLELFDSRSGRVLPCPAFVEDRCCGRCATSRWLTMWASDLWLC